MKNRTPEAARPCRRVSVWSAAACCRFLLGGTAKPGRCRPACRQAAATCRRTVRGSARAPACCRRRPPRSVRPRSAGFQPAVSRTSSRPRRAVRRAPAGWKPALRQTGSLRYASTHRRLPAFGIRYLASGIRHPASGIWHLASAPTPQRRPVGALQTLREVGRRCAGAAHPAARQRGPTDSAGKPAHSKRCATDRAFDPRASVWSAAACCRFFLREARPTRPSSAATCHRPGSASARTRARRQRRPPRSVRPRSAGFQPAVSRTSSRPRRAVRRAPAGWKPALRQTGSLRYASTHRRLPAFGIRYLASGIRHPASGIWHLASAPTPQRRPVGALQTLREVGRRCAGAAHPAARQRGPTDSAGKPAHSKRCATDRAFDPRASVWSAAACCRFFLREARPNPAVVGLPAGRQRPPAAARFGGAPAPPRAADGAPRGRSGLVAQVSNLLYRGLPVGPGGRYAAHRRVGNPRYGRLEVCATPAPIAASAARPSRRAPARTAGRRVDGAGRPGTLGA